MENDLFRFLPDGATVAEQYAACLRLGFLRTPAAAYACILSRGLCHCQWESVQAEKHAGDGASEAAEDKKEASVEEPAALVAASDAQTPGKRWGARVVLMSGVNAR